MFWVSGFPDFNPLRAANEFLKRSQEVTQPEEGEALNYPKP